MKENIFLFIVEYKASHGGNSPTMREIREWTGLVSNQSIINYLGQLEKDKKISLGKDKTTRSIQVIGGVWSYEEPRSVPIQLE